MNTWNLAHCNTGEQYNDFIGLAMQETGLSKHFNVIVNDDCWQSYRNSSGYIVPDPARFPNGYSAVVQKLKDYQIDSGLYTARGSRTC